MAENYVIRVTAGSSYDISTHTEVPVNTPTPVSISHPHMRAELSVRVKDYSGLPRNSPKTSPYFSTPEHTGDTYSLALSFTPLKPSEDGKALKEGDNPEKVDDDEDEAPLNGIAGGDLQWGNDFEHPIRDRLPPGFGTALNIVRWWIDPGLEGDAYADKPYLYGPALSSFNALRVGAPPTPKKAETEGEEDPTATCGIWVEEGGDEAGEAWREERGVPTDRKARMKWALGAAAKESWVWEYGRTYAADFFNGYLDFSDFALRLPGYNMPIMKYWDGQGLRYVLRNRSTGEAYLVVIFTLYRTEVVNEDGTLKPEASENQATISEGDLAAAAGKGKEDGDFDEEAALKEAKRRLSEVDLDETRPDDVD